MTAALLALVLAFHGNVALNEDVYRSVLSLPAETAATPQAAQRIAAQLRTFLHRAGYELAQVSARAHDDQIDIDVDEGHLDKIILVGGDVIETLRLKLDLDLPGNVFNRPELQRQLHRVAARSHLADFAYELVPVERKDSRGPQLDDLQPLDELRFLRPGLYELHILVVPGVWTPGLSPELEIDSLEGGGLGAEYRNGHLFLPGDRWTLHGRLAGAVRDRLDGSGSRPAFTRGTAELRWDAPPPAGDVLRPSLSVRADLSDRQRPDLFLESFKYATLESAVEVRVTPSEIFSSGAGIGLERRFLFSVEPRVGSTPPMPITSFAQTRPYFVAHLGFLFDPKELRRDQHHELWLEGRAYGSDRDPAGTDHAGTVRLLGRYQKMWPFDWHEFWIEGRGVYRGGDVLFSEEESVGGDSLRGPFGADYTRRLAALKVEARFSILRDLLKLGVFHNAVVYGAIDRATGRDKVRTADAFGLGLHALFLDEFQLDAWFGVGFSSDGRFERGGALDIRQAF